MTYKNLINSPSICRYIEETNYRFNQLEYAWLIYQSNKPIKEKHRLWKQLIKEMPSMMFDVQVPFKETLTLDLHEFLMRYMSIQNRLLSLLEKDEPDVAYQFHEKYSSSEPIKTFQRCCELFRIRIDNTQYEKLFKHFKITKHYLSNENLVVTAIMDIEPESDKLDVYDITLGNTTSFRLEAQNGIISDEEFVLFYYAFDNLNLELPVPFKEGDILIDLSKKCMVNPFTFSGDKVFVGSALTQLWCYYHFLQYLRSSKVYCENPDDKALSYCNIFSCDYYRG